MTTLVPDQEALTRLGTAGVDALAPRERRNAFARRPFEWKPRPTSYT
jgi:hypothetical protein